MKFATYGHDLHPVIVIAPEQPNSTESELQLAIESLYGARNLIKFTNSLKAIAYLKRHKGLSHINPTVIAVYDPEQEDQIATFLSEVSVYSSKKLLVISEEYHLPQLLARDPEMFNDDIMYAFRLNRDVMMQELKYFSGQALTDHQDVDWLCQPIQ